MGMFATPGASVRVCECAVGAVGALPRLAPASLERPGCAGAGAAAMLLLRAGLEGWGVGAPAGKSDCAEPKVVVGGSVSLSMPTLGAGSQRRS